MRRIQPEVGAPVLEHDPRRAAHDPRAEAHVVRLDQADHHAVRIGGAQVHGASARAVGWHESLRPLRRNSRCQPGRVLGGEQLRRVRQPAIRIRHASVPLAPGNLDRLDLRMQAIGAERLAHRPVQGREDVQRHQARDALRVRRDGGHLDVAVPGGDRLDPVASVLRDVRRGHHATGGLDGPRDLGADRSAVIRVATSLADRSQ